MTSFSPVPQHPKYQHHRQKGLADDIDFSLHGEECQFVTVELDSGESAIAEAGSMMCKDSAIVMQTVFGDGSGQEGGFMGKLLGAGKRLLTGESLFLTVFTHQGSGKAEVCFAAPYPGKIVPLQLRDMPDGQIICQKDAFLCAARGVEIGIHFQKRILTGLFGGEGFIMQKLTGDGWVFIHAGGNLVERQLSVGEILHVDTGCLVALEPSVDYDITSAGSIKSMIFGGEGMFFAVLQGPGKVWLQSLPFSRLAGRVLASGAGLKDRGEGSILGKGYDLLGGR